MVCYLLRIVTLMGLFLVSFPLLLCAHTFDISAEEFTAQANKIIEDKVNIPERLILKDGSAALGNALFNFTTEGQKLAHVSLQLGEVDRTRKIKPEAVALGLLIKLTNLTASKEERSKVQTVLATEKMDSNYTVTLNDVEYTRTASGEKRYTYTAEKLNAQQGAQDTPATFKWTINEFVKSVELVTSAANIPWEVKKLSTKDNGRYVAYSFGAEQSVLFTLTEDRDKVAEATLFVDEYLLVDKNDEASRIALLLFLSAVRPECQRGEYAKAIDEITDKSLLMGGKTLLRGVFVMRSIGPKGSAQITATP